MKNIYTYTLYIYIYLYIDIHIHYIHIHKHIANIFAITFYEHFYKHSSRTPLRTLELWQLWRSASAQHGACRSRTSVCAVACRVRKGGRKGVRVLS